MINIKQIKDMVNFYDLAMYFDEQKIKVSYNNVSFCCPFHEGDDTPSLFYNTEWKSGRCYSCRKTFDVFDYVMFKLKTDKFMDSVKFLCSFCGIQFENINFEIKPVDNYVKEFNSLRKYTERERPDFVALTEDDMSSMVKMRGDFWLNRGFTKETLDHFEVGFSPQHNRVVIPVRSIDGVLVGATARTIYKDYKERGLKKWQHLPGSNIAGTFFNIKDGINCSKSEKCSIIVCEGPADVMWLWQNGIRNVIGLMSNALTPAKKMVLLKNFVSIYLFLDGDNGGDVGVSSIVKDLKGYFSVFQVQCPPGKDPDDLNSEQLRDLLSHTIKLC